MTVSPVFELVCGAQSYDWGKLGKDGSKVSQFAQGLPDFKYDEDKPYAELWMGTHPSCPSTLLETKENLKQYLKQHPELLGEKVVKHFGDDLPFLFKVLAIRKALSIQAHPDKKLAKKLYDERPDIYKDPNHKPEMAVALTPFSGFCGFRRPSEIASFLSSIPELASVVGDKVAESFRSKFGDNASPSEEDKKAGLKDLFSALMKADEANVKTQVEKLVERLAKEKNQTEETRLVATLNRDFPGDIGIFCTFCLNIVHLKPGEAVFLKANEPHAYLDGDIMECMATSDNVVRAGLTPKLRDVPTLTTMLTYTSSPPSEQILPPVKFRSTQHTTLYDPPIEEFSVLLTVLEQGQTEKFEPIDGPSILIFTELQGDASAELKVGQEKGSEVTRTGQVFFIGASVEAEIEATGGKVVAYRAFVEAP
ncbi:mannose-6-phosphate isomerase [Microbotryum lychnidis-dioicae p1A1 Lamole]|uniref:Mannose-6-phosphate isomerase n=1 Tax=Microbotryum lychnidis-dioicae (strain p1A1 Lamole / MvSl-1064) TaxID=683840 RepID=U5H4U5_USTV1|nr:mannose-6-phosphate isomerase [Microbotryum lychnidis-dioicae p1A1 Lamole]|eukprot:KDE07466.1 mannose-6-phosphate isomerase [Microbotryum lychnidis-dioicae p1A1 Lamole]